jgi:hypothetical protein
MVNLDKLQEQINANIAIAELLDITESFCPQKPTVKHQGKETEVEILVHNFSRYTKRSMYFAELFLYLVKKEIDAIRKRLADSNKKGKVITHVSDEIYYNFDAFVMSAKSIVEGGIAKKARKLQPPVWDEFEKFSKPKFDGFIKNYLAPCRNEVVHLLSQGSAWHSSAYVDEERNIFFRGFKLKKEDELLNMFETILNEMSEIIDKVCRLLMENTCLLYGYPEKDVTFRSSTNIVNLSAFVKINQLPK